MTISDTPASGSSHSLARHTTISLFGKVVGRGFHFLSEVMLARYLGAAAFGMFSIAWNVLRIAGLVAPLGLDIAVMEAGGKCSGDSQPDLSRSIRIAFGFVLLVGCGIAGILVWTSNDLANMFDKQEAAQLFVAISIGIPAAAGLKVLAAGLRAGQKMGSGILLEELLPPLLMLMGVGILFILGGGSAGAARVAWISYLLTLTAAVFVSKNFLDFNIARLSWAEVWTELLAMLRFSLPTALATILGVMLLMIDRVIVAVLLPEEEVGIYQGVVLIALVFTTILSAFKIAIAPRIPGLVQRRDDLELKRLATWSTRWGLYLSLPFFLVVLVFPKELLNVLYGPAFVVGAGVLIASAVGQLVNVVSGPIEHLLIFAGYRKEWLLLSVGAFLLTVILHLWLIPVFGLMGAGLSVLFTFAGLSAISMIRVRQQIGFWVIGRSFLKTIVASVVILAVLLPIQSTGWVNSLGAFVVIGGLTSFLLAVVLYVLGLETEDQALVRDLLARVKNFIC